MILGGGFAGAYCAQALQRQRGLDAEVVLIDRNNYFVFTPLLIEAGTGSIEPRHAVVPMRAFLKTAEFLMAEVVGADMERRRITYRLVGADADQAIDYDHLVIALGSVTRLPDVPGLREHGVELKSLADAVGLRDRSIALLERANATEDPQERRALLHFVVIGGNFTGVEAAGEGHMFLQQAARLYRHVDASEATVTLVELGDRILGALGDDLSEYAAAKLRARGMTILLGTTVTEITHDQVTLTDGSTLRTHTAIWCAGIAPNPVTKGWALPVDQRGYILCERDLRVRGMDNVWAIGDGAVNTDAGGTAYPATAQHAIQQGRVLAGNLAAVLGGRPTRPCDIRSRGSLAAIGCRTGVAKVYGIKLSGFAAWWLWRTVYLLKMPTLARKVRVALDWTIDFFFSRDYVQLGLHRTIRRPRDHDVQSGG